MPKISIIVPVYNKGQYLRGCLDSLMNQSLEEIEILCIDDKSTDDSPDILQEYASKDRRVRVFHQESNKGVSAARNTGIQKACGEFIAFADADDFVETDFYEKLYSASAGYDCVKGEIWDYDSDINSCSLNNTYNLNERIRQTGRPSWFTFGFTSAIYRKDFVDSFGFHFPEDVRFFEDPYFSITLAARLSAVKLVDGAKYYYRAVSSSLSRRITPKGIDDLYRIIFRISSYLKQCGSPIEDRYIAATQLMSVMCPLIENGSLDGDRLHLIEKEFISLLRPGNQAVGRVLVSVIVPVYNGERYLRRTLSCLLLQSLYNIEIICVNDCSTDGSMNILTEYQKEDKRIRIIDCPENGGESRARNAGIRAAEGEYIAFIDQDDRIDLSFYGTLYRKAEESHSDIVKGEAVEHHYNGQVFEERCYQVEKQPLYFNGNWWTAIYRRAFILENHIELPEGYPLGGDLKFLFDACRACKKLSLVSGVFYHHLMHPDSGDSEETPYFKMTSVIAVFSYILDGIESLNLYDRDKDCYVFFYLSYIQHAYMRIQKCPEPEGKKLCSDFIFQRYDSCRCKSALLDKLHVINSYLSDVLKNRQKQFFDSLIGQDVLCDVFYGKAGKDKSASITADIVVPFLRPDIAEKYIVRNSFLKEEDKIRLHLIDNRPHNRPVSMIFNEFLDSYDYSMESWLILMHSDFEFLTFPSNVLCRLDPAKIYGPVGTKVYQDKGKMYVVRKGGVLEKTPDNTLYLFSVFNWNDLSVDTLDCQCVIMHSSLVRRHRLRFDEHTAFDLYVEDFCIRAGKEHGIRVEAVDFDCAHHSSYVQKKTFSPRYLDALKYVNGKYPDDIFGGSVTPIGGKPLPSMSHKEFQMFRIRREMLTGIKL